MFKFFRLSRQLIFDVSVSCELADTCVTKLLCLTPH